MPVEEKNHMSEFKRCGTCHFTELVAQDITKRICFGAPPSAIQLPAPNGKMTFQMARPIISVSDRACSFHRTKDAVDVAKDVDTIRMLQTPETSEIKQ
jgi:hypothetical protein